MQINVLNDAYYIWFSGTFATINGLRVGKLINHPQVDWPGILMLIKKKIHLLYFMNI